MHKFMNFQLLKCEKFHYMIVMIFSLIDKFIFTVKRLVRNFAFFIKIWHLIVKFGNSWENFVLFAKFCKKIVQAYHNLANFAKKSRIWQKNMKI